MILFLTYLQAEIQHFPAFQLGQVDMSVAKTK